MKMKAVRYYAPEDLRFEEVEIKEPDEGEILIKVEAALTCGTDVKTFRRGHPLLIKETPSGFGHEFSGTVYKVGKNVQNFKAGDRVVAANSAPCGECFFCRHGQENLCENLEFLNGAYAEYLTIPKRIAEKNTVKIPDNLPFELAALCEPLANVCHGLARTPVQKGDTVGVMGIGPIGLMFCALLKLKGAHVIAMGRNPLKLRLAKEFAQADEVIDLTKTEDVVSTVLSLTEEKRGLDVGVECVGLKETWEDMFKMVRKGGCIHLFGGCKSGTKVEFDAKRLHYDEVKLISVFHHTPKYFREALDIISSGKIDFNKLITARLPLELACEAIKMHANGEAIKVLLEM